MKYYQQTGCTVNGFLWMNDRGNKRYLVSGCLLGLKTRYDGAAKPSPQCKKILEKALFWAPVCPEQLGGLATPRLPAEIRGGNGNDVPAGVARVVNSIGEDVTEQFLEGARQVLFLAEELGVDCVLLKGGSPSCGCGKVLGVTAALLLKRGFQVEEL